jgi:iron complex outermembrane recepter protein
MNLAFRGSALVLLWLWLWLSAGASAQDDSDAGVEDVLPPPPIAAAAESGSAPLEYGAVAVAPAPFGQNSLARVPSNVQRIQSGVLEEQAPLGLHDALLARLGSATLNDVQNNPLQPDLQYRGFTASPLLGTPQGLAVYQNGVRVNEPFGDLLQWDTLPTFAVAELQVLPGANALYGPNALGGSLALRMKDGFRNPGYRIEGWAGSFARYTATAEYGHAFGEWAVYAGASLFGERGFRDHSSSSAGNLYADVRQRTSDHEVALNVSYASTDLYGNGPVPVELLATSRREVFTWPDNTKNDALLIVAEGQQKFGDHLNLQGTAYLRHGLRETYNGDEGETEYCSEDSQELCDEDGEPLRTETQQAVIAAVPYDGLFNRTETDSQAYGGSLQLSANGPLGSLGNLLIAGASYDGASNAFLQRAELGYITADRTILGQNVFLAGDEFRTELEAWNQLVGVYVSDTLNVSDSLAITASARLNWARLELDDRTGTALDGEHTYARVNPAFGVTFAPAPRVTVFASYGESNRAPSASELACADPDAPCRLPNAFIADPPLDQVVSRSVELGVRGRFGPRRAPLLEGSLSLFGARNSDDILFVAGSRVGTGYFRNSGTTQRVGLELGLAGAAGSVDWYASYTLLRATFESSLTLPAADHPEADDGVIEVAPGDRIPGLPTHSVKAGVTVAPLRGLRVGLSTIAQSSQPYRGDEANLLEDLDGFVTLSAHASYDLFAALRLLVKAQNLLNAEYETFGVIADPSDVLPGADNPRFVSPGPPLGVWVGIELHEP